MKPCEIAIGAVINKQLMKAKGGGQVCMISLIFLSLCVYIFYVHIFNTPLLLKSKKGSENFLLIQFI